MDQTWRVVGTGALSLMLLMTACGSGSGTSDGGGGGAYGAGGGGYGSSRSTPTDAASSGGGGAEGSEGSGAETLTQVNYQFMPAKLTVAQGDTITVSDTNPTTPHTFTVEGTDIDVTNDAQSSQAVTIDLEPGTYTFFCRFHRAKGMEGTLTVT